MIKQFGRNDKFVNTIRLHPSWDIFVHSGSTFLNNKVQEGIALSSSAIYVNPINVNRVDSQLVYPYVFKSAEQMGFAGFNNQYVSSSFGTMLTGSYATLTASLGFTFQTASASRPKIRALKNELNRFSRTTKWASYDYYDSEELMLVEIPRLFHGSGIKPGTVELNFYITGTLIGQLKDEGSNGVLMNTTGLLSGSKSGIVVYKHGIILLSGTSSVSNNQDMYNGSFQQPRWTHFGLGTINATSSSFEVKFSGTTNIQTVTLFAHANEFEFNHSNNPTSVYSGSGLYSFDQTSGSYDQPNRLLMVNSVSGSFVEESEPFKRQTMISNVWLYNENKEPIAQASLSTPILKKEDRGLTFKFKVDI